MRLGHVNKASHAWSRTQQSQFEQRAHIFARLDLRYWGGGELQACPEATPTWFVIKMFFYFTFSCLLTNRAWRLDWLWCHCAAGLNTSPRYCLIHVGFCWNKTSKRCTGVFIGAQLESGDTLLQEKNSTGRRWDLNWTQVPTDSMTIDASALDHYAT